MYGKGGSDRVPGIEGKAEVLAPHAVFLTISEQLGGPEFRSSGGRDRLCQCWMKVGTCLGSFWRGVLVYFMYIRVWG